MSLFFDRFLKVLLFLCASVTVLTTVAVLWMLGEQSFEFFSQVPVSDFLFGTRWTPLLDPKSFGVLPLVSGTVLIVIGAVGIALPAGLLVAVYLSEFAHSRVRAFVKPVLEILAGIPTVVYGYFALTFVTPLLKHVFPDIQIFNAASGAIVVAIMILPMISSLCDDAFRAIPMHMREAGYGLGANSFEVVFGVLIPASMTRIMAALILAISRAVGETMAVTLAAGATPNMTLDPLQSIQTMTAYIVQVSLGDTPAGGIEYLTCFVVGALLFVGTMLMNILGGLLMSRVQK